LEQEYTGKVKCVCIDPPYNTGNAFEHYDDGLEHSVWLSLIRDRIELIHRLLSEDGSLWISIDDDESHYLKVLCDEIFGRINFINNVIWEKKYSPQNDAKWLSDSHDHILVYAKNKEIWRPHLLPRTEEMNNRYKNYDNDVRGVWKSSDLSVKTYSKATDYPIKTPKGRIVNPPAGYCWRVSKEKFDELIKENRIWFGKDGNNVPSIKRFLSDVQEGSVTKTLWFRDEVGDNQEAKREVKEFDNNNVFATPKPERLIQRILQLSTKEKDLVLDSFLGSATTAAVAHKMGRRWIGIELGEHCYTHCIPRLKKVIDGEDMGGITESVNWKGGGGFRFYELGPTLIKDDEWGNPVINPEFKPEMLAEAMCKLEGFTYKPSDEYFWIHGYSTESDYIYVTTQFMSRDMLTKISDEVGTERSLLICCSAFKCNPTEFPNLTIKKIPKAVLKKCEWDHDDYSLEIKNLTEVTKSPDLSSDEKVEKKTKKFGKGKDDSPELPGFDLGAVK